MALFEDQSAEQLRLAAALVEQTVRALGIDPAAARVTTTDGSSAWALKRGSASILVVLHGPREGEPDGTIRVVAPVIRLPAPPMRPALFERLLVLNGRELLGVAFGVVGDEVVVLSERSVRDLDASEVDVTLRTVGRIADRYDDALAKEFGATRSADRPS